MEYIVYMCDGPIQENTEDQPNSGTLSLGLHKRDGIYGIYGWWPISRKHRRSTKFRDSFTRFAQKGWNIWYMWAMAQFKKTQEVNQFQGLFLKVSTKGREYMVYMGDGPIKENTVGQSISGTLSLGQHWKGWNTWYIRVIALFKKTQKFNQFEGLFL